MILIHNNRIAQHNIVRDREIESISVVCRCLGARSTVWRVTRRVVECEAGYSQPVAASHVEAVGWPVLDVKVGDHAIDHLVEDNEVVGPNAGLVVVDSCG